MEIKCIIVDDEIHARKVLEKFIQDIPHITLLASCKNALEAMQALNKYSVDVMFLDINMPKISGLSFLESLTNPPLIVITTAYREYALDAYELDVIDYLHKPIPFPRFLKSISKIEEKINGNINQQTTISTPQQPTTQKDYIFIKADKKTIKLDFSQLTYIEGLGDYIKIHTTSKQIVSKLSVKKMEDLLPSHLFPRVHKSYIVAIDKIIAIDGNQIEIANTKIPIGQIYKQAFMNLVDPKM